MTYLLAAGLLAATVAPPTPAASTPPKTDEFALVVAGSEVGTESVTRTKTETGETVEGQSTLTTPGGSVHFTYRLDLAGGKPTRYRLDVEGVPSAGTVVAARTASGWRFEATYKASEAPPTVVERPVTGSSVVIDNNLASHLDLLTRTLDLAPGAKATLTAVVPQALQVFPIEIARLDDAAGARHYRLTMASALIELVARTADGALLEASVPMQRAVYRRKGWEPVATEPVKGDPREREIVVSSRVGPLPGVLVMPVSEKRVAAVLLLSGSGPQDRDETIGPNKPLRDIALGLADRGIASLRFDKRTHAFPAKSDATLAAEYLDDAAKALAILRAIAGIDAKRVFIAGHSLGGTVTPMVTSRAKDAVRGMILLAPAVRRVDDMVVDQVATQVRLARMDDAAAKAKVNEVKDALARALDPANKDAAPVLGAPASYWREIAALDVAKMLGDSSLPFLVIQGDKDIQVRPDLDFGVLREKLGEAHGRATYKLVPGVNHLLMRVDGSSTGAEYAIPGHVVPEVAMTMAGWMDTIAP